ncbi:MAG TPA: hypothetical protein VD833_22050 [Vicinamibacterales bacterium]|nr:hypothetical protein [Vicinamibacterales bacterium]
MLGEPDSWAVPSDWLAQFTARNRSATLWVAFAAVGFVLLIAWK